MIRVLAFSILMLAVVFFGLAFVILANKAWREIRNAWRTGRRGVLEPKILQYAHGDEPSVVACLGGAVRRQDRRVLEWILNEHAQRVRGVERARLTKALDQLGFVDEYIAQLGSRRWWKRADGAEKLGLAGAHRAIDALVARLDDDVSEVRLRAAKALGSLGGVAAIRPLIQALSEPNRWSTIRIADILAGTGNGVVDELVDAFPEMNADAKVAALDIIGKVRPLRVAAWLPGRLEEQDADVRARACHAMGCVGDPDSGPDLIRALGDDAWPVRAMAGKAIGRIRYEEAISGLCRALRDREWWVRSNSAEALRMLGSKGIEALRHMLDSDDTYARHQAVLMLQEAGVLDDEVSRLADPDEGRRASARHFVDRLVQVGQLDRLRELNASHPDALVRERLGELLPAEEKKQAEQAEAAEGVTA